MSQNASIGSVMVIGAGIAGIQASLDLANSGYLVYLVEKNPAIGGIMAQLDKTFPTNDCSMCIISPKLVECGRHLNIDLLTMTDVMEVTGGPGSFKVRILERPRFVDIKKCTACGECSKACPVEVPNAFDQNLRDRKAVYKLYPQAMPSGYAIEKRGTAPCKSTCPAHVSIQGYVALINQGKYREALELFKEAHPFPAICGRVCHHPCERVCTRGDLDEPIAIQYLHRFLADYELKQERRFTPKAQEQREEKVAIVGAGPAGMTAAYYLVKQGYRPTVFEKLPVTGGMMAVGIPEYRLPRDILASEIRFIQDLGVEIRTGVEFGKDVTSETLKREGYKALFVATGLHLGRKLNVEGEQLPGILNGVEFLREVSLGRAVELKKDVVVIGGGNVAIDVALTARRKGAEKVTLVCLEKREEMPAWDYEIQEAIEEGVTIVNSRGPKKFIETEGRVSAVQFKRCTSVFDQKKAFNPQYDESDLITIDCGSAIVAIGQAGDVSFAGKEGIPLTPRGGLNADPLTLQTPVEWIFAGGDALYGPKSVVEAVACGKEAAESIHRYLNGKDLREGRSQEWKYEKPDTAGEAKTPRIPMRKLPPLEREGNFREVSLGFSEEEARAEANRCLKCGICSECYQCVSACLAGAVNHSMKSRERVLEVGAVILAPGFQPYDPGRYLPYEYAKHPNVVTSMEYERILSATGPFQGHLVRPSDHKEPRKIAWLQCIGSRDLHHCGHGYCSAVCCMYAVKEAIISKEHAGRDLECAIFFMDMRTYGKEFERYYDDAREKYGIRFIRSRVPTIERVIGSDDLMIPYVSETGKIIQERFDMVVLSVGLEIAPDAASLASRLGLKLTEGRFCETGTFEPVRSSREGIFVCGVFQGPKDIPQSVMEASASAAASTENLAAVRGSLIRTKELPPELDVSGEIPRIGVFVCNCGINIGGVADVPAVREYARTLPYVVHVEDNLFTCSQDTQDRMKQVIRENKINRVVVASCSPRTHEPLFQETIREVGLNKYLFEMANIRDQNTWVHMNNPAKATEKAKDLVRMAAAKAALVEPLQQVALSVTKSVLVVGGGLAGLRTALGLAQQGYQTYLVEKTATLGGVALRLRTTWKGEQIGPFLQDLISRVRANPLIEIFTETEVTSTSGVIGNFMTTLLGANGNSRTLQHGATVLATGGVPYKPEEYLYGKHPGVLTHLELDEALASGGIRVKDAKCAVFIQCVGSRIPERPYCSKVCCTHSLESAVTLKKLNPEMHVLVLFRDMRSYGFRENLYLEARKQGVIFIRYDLAQPPELTAGQDGVLSLKVTGHALGRPLQIRPDLVVLATAILPNENRKLFEMFKVPTNAAGFLIEAHAKLRPVDFASEGIFMAGLAHYPKPVDETITQAMAAVSRALTLLSKDVLHVGGVSAAVNPDRCAACLTCVRTCPYGAPRIGDDGFALIDPSACRGCGACAAECPGKAIALKHFTDEQILAKTGALFCKASS